MDIMGQGSPYFCKLICPAGTLEGGIPLALLNKSMRSALGALYVWKNAILVVTIILSIIILYIIFFPTYTTTNGSCWTSLLTASAANAL